MTDNRVDTLIRKLADDIIAVRDVEVPDRMATIDAAANTPGALAYSEKLITDLAAKYHDKPMPKLSAKARGQQTEILRPLREGSKWGLPG